MNDPAKNRIDELLAAYRCGGLIEAATEMTATIVINWILAMTLYPETAKIAQEEIDRVFGGRRLPNWYDKKGLHYVGSMVKEVLRWRPVNQFGMFHTTSEDD